MFKSQIIGVKKPLSRIAPHLVAYKSLRLHLASRTKDAVEQCKHTRSKLRYIHKKINGYTYVFRIRSSAGFRKSCSNLANTSQKLFHRVYRLNSDLLGIESNAKRLQWKRDKSLDLISSGMYWNLAIEYLTIQRSIYSNPPFYDISYDPNTIPWELS